MSHPCSVPACDSNFKSRPKPSFHRFPTCAYRKREWEEFVSLSISAPFSAERHHKLCSKHFEPRHFSWQPTRGFGKKRKLHETAVPTRHLSFARTAAVLPDSLDATSGARPAPAELRKSFPVTFAPQLSKNVSSLPVKKRASEDDSVGEDRAVWGTTDHDYIKTMTRPNLYKYRTPVDMKPLNIVEDVRISQSDGPNHGANRQFSEREPEDILSDVQMNDASTIEVASLTKTEPHDEESTPFPAGRSAGVVVQIDERMDAHTLPTVKTEPYDEQTDSALSDEDGYLAEESPGTSSYLASLAQSMYQMQKDGAFCDLVLCISDGDGIPNNLNSVKVHRNVFSAVSETIRNLHGSILRLNEDVSIDDIHKVVEYVYTGKISNLGELAPQDISRISYAAYVLDVRKCVGYIRFERLKRGSLTANRRSQDRRFQIRDSSPDACGASVTPPDIDDYLPLPVEIWERPTSADEDVDVLLQQQLLDSTDTSEGEMVEQSCRPKSRKKKKRHNLVEFSQEIPLYATQNKGQGIKTGPRKTFSGHKIDFRTKSQKTLHRAVS